MSTNCINYTTYIDCLQPYLQLHRYGGRSIARETHKRHHTPALPSSDVCVGMCSQARRQSETRLAITCEINRARLKGRTIDTDNGEHKLMNKDVQACLRCSVYITAHPQVNLLCHAISIDVL